MTLYSELQYQLDPRLLDWAVSILATEGFEEWRVFVQALCPYLGCAPEETHEIVIPVNAGPGIILHEIAHIGFKGHGRPWQRRLIELTDKYTEPKWVIVNA